MLNITKHQGISCYNLKWSTVTSAVTFMFWVRTGKTYVGRNWWSLQFCSLTIYTYLNCHEAIDSLSKGIITTINEHGQSGWGQFGTIKETIWHQEIQTWVMKPLQVKNDRSKPSFTLWRLRRYPSCHIGLHYYGTVKHHLKTEPTNTMNYNLNPLIISYIILMPTDE